MKEGWTYKKLGEVARVQNGYAFDSKLFNENGNGTPLIRIRDIKRNHTYTYTTEDCSKEFFIENGDLLIGMDGDFNVCTWEGGHAYLNQRVCHVIPSNQVIAKFIYYLLPFPLKRINDKTTFATVKHLSSKQVGNIMMPVPSLDEQQRIVERLDSAFENIDKLKANAEKQLSEARILFQKSLAKAMKPKEGWEERLLSEIVHPNCSLSYGIVQPGDHVENGIPVVRPVDFNNQLYVKMDGLKRTKPEIADAYQRTILKGGEILLCVRGTTGTMGIASDELIGCNVTRGIVPIYFDVEVCTKFVYYELLSPSLQDEIAHKTTGAALKQINIKDLRNLHMSIPPLAEQQRIIERLDSLSENVRKYEEIQRQIISECDALKQALLRKVFE